MKCPALHLAPRRRTSAAQQEQGLLAQVSPLLLLLTGKAAKDTINCCNTHSCNLLLHTSRTPLPSPENCCSSLQYLNLPLCTALCSAFHFYSGCMPPRRPMFVSILNDPGSSVTCCCHEHCFRNSLQQLNIANSSTGSASPSGSASLCCGCN